MSSPDYDSSEGSDDEENEIPQLNEGKCQDNIEIFISNYVSADGNLPWRCMMHASDSYVLWSCATGKAFRGPVYSTETTESGNPIVIHEAHYVDTREPDQRLKNLVKAIETRLTSSELDEFKNDLHNARPDKYSLVGFVHGVLECCGVAKTPVNICLFLIDLPRWNML